MFVYIYLHSSAVNEVSSLLCAETVVWRVFNSCAPLPVLLPSTPLHGEAWREMKYREKVPF